MPNDGVSAEGWLDDADVWREKRGDLSWAAGRAAVFLDRDGVVAEETGYLHRVEDLALIPGAAEFIAEANRRGIPVVVASNQSGIARGYFGWPEFHAVQAELNRRLESAGARVDLTLACPHYPEHPDRKPCPGMFAKAAAMAGLDLGRSWMIGDKASDLEAGRAAGLAGGTLVLTGHGRKHRAAALALATDKFPVRVEDSIREAWAALGEAPARLRVLLLARELGLGGSERQLAETALALDRAAFEPHVACFRAGGFRAGELERAGVPVLPLGVRSLVSRSAIAAARRLGRYVRRHGIQVVHAFDVPTVLFAVPVARLYGVPVVLSSQRAHRDLTPGLTRHLLRLTDRLVDGIVVNSRAVARELVEEDRVPRGMLHLAYNGIDTERFRAEGCRAALPWPAAGLVIGVACALRPEKGLFTLLEGFARLRRSHPEARLVMVGSGPLAGPLAQRAVELGLAGDCHFEPAVDEVAPWLRVMDIFVLPSLSEALSNSLMEAMACGCCAVASDAGGNPELIEDGVNGVLFRAGDSEALAAVLESLASQPDLRGRLARAGTEFIRGGFSREEAARRMGRIYAEACCSASMK